MASEKVKEIELLRAFGALCVILIHTTCHFTKIVSAGPVRSGALLADMFASCAVPLFIFISGFVLYRNYSSGFPVIRFYRNRFLSVVPQYLLFSVLYMTVFGGKFSIDARALLHNLLTAGASDHLWFFIVLIELYLLYPPLLLLFKAVKRKQAVPLLLVGSLCLNMATNTAVVHRAEKLGLAFIGSIPSFSGYAFYFLMGIVVADRYDEVRNMVLRLRSLYAAAVCGALTLVSGSMVETGLHHGFNYYRLPDYFLLGQSFLNPVLFTASFCLFLRMALRLADGTSWLFAVLTAFGKYSLGIYLVHMAILTNIKLVLQWYYGIGYTQWSFYVILFSATVVASFAVARLIGFLPYSRYMIGVHDAPAFFQKTCSGGYR